MSETGENRVSLPVACTLTAAELAARREGLLPGLLARARAREMVAGGFRWRFDPDDGLLREVAGVIDAERRCCPFLRFLLVVEPGGGPVWIEVTGPEGTREFLSMLAGAAQEERSVSADCGVILKRFERPDDVRVFDKGRFEIVRLGGVTIGRATYQPGWKWSADVGPLVGSARCTVEHVGLVLGGEATAAFDDGRVVELKAGELFYIPPVPHDSWVVGGQPYASLHFLGAGHYAAR